MTNMIDPPAATRSVRVIGIGNPDRGDDGISALVTSRLAGRLLSDVCVLTRSGDLMMIGDDVAAADALICIDASAPMGAPGRIRRIDLTTGKPERDMSFTSSHAFGLADAIALAEALGVASRHIVVYAIEGASFDAGAAMTEAVAAAAEQVADCVIAEAMRLRGGSQEGLSHA